VIDDGSTDRTIEVAREHGVDHIVRPDEQQGAGLRLPGGRRRLPQARRRRHRQHGRRQPVLRPDIAKLVAPILRRGRHGRRRPPGHDHRALLAGQEGAAAPRLWVVRAASDTAVADTTSGFRAYNREAALALQVVSKFTYTLETIIQAGKMTVAVDHVPVRTNGKLRESRLFPSMWTYIRRNGLSIFRIYSMYEPLRVFMTGACCSGSRRSRCSRASRTSTSRATARATCSR
jgi:hypothetical protein